MESHQNPWFQTTNQLIPLLIPLLIPSLTIMNHHHVPNHQPDYDHQGPTDSPVRICRVILPFYTPFIGIKSGVSWGFETGNIGTTSGKIIHIITGAEVIWLVVSPPPKNMKVSWDDYSQYMEK
jgi:hypothetical protein